MLRVSFIFLFLFLRSRKIVMCQVKALDGGTRTQKLLGRYSHLNLPSHFLFSCSHTEVCTAVNKTVFLCKYFGRVLGDKCSATSKSKFRKFKQKGKIKREREKDEETSYKSSHRWMRYNLFMGP